MERENLRNPGDMRPWTLLMLPGPKKHEICTALEHGFPLENLILIGDKAADFANMTRNFLSDYPPDKRPELPPHPTGLLSDRCRELAAQGVKIKVANLDFKDPIETMDDDKPFMQIQQFMLSGIMREGILAINVLNARAPGALGEKAKRASTPEEWKNSKPRTDSRKMIIKTAVSRFYDGRITLMDSDIYKNGPSPMLWVIYRLEER